jgi:hypothetical protein
LNLDPAVVAVPAVKPLEQRDVVVERQLKTLEPSLHRAAQFSSGPRRKRGRRWITT